jgi:hypothetical protein
VKPLTAGSEIDAWCTKCRMDLGHRIVAMVGGGPKRVICQTCGSQHNYRAPRSAVSERGARPRSAGNSGKAPSVPRVTQKAKAEAERVNDWESRIAGQRVDAFTRYSMDQHFQRDQLILHSKFGEGYVMDVLEDGKVNIMFRDGPKTLAHAPR